MKHTAFIQHPAVSLVKGSPVARSSGAASSSNTVGAVAPIAPRSATSGSSTFSSAFFGRSIGATAGHSPLVSGQAAAARHEVVATVAPPQGSSTAPPAKEEQDIYAFGAHIQVTDVMQIPISVEHFWSGFDDFMALQVGLSLHENTQRVPGTPENGVGAQIVFDFGGGKTYERLTIKDDVNHVWQIDIPEPNALFSFYQATIKVYEGKNGPEASMALDVVLRESDRQKRIDVLRTSQTPRGTRIRELLDFVLERDGKRIDFDFSVDRSIDELWGIISNWNDVSWVQGATGVDASMTPPATRTIKFANGAETFEVLRKLDNDKKLLSYTIEKSAGMPVELLKDTLTLSARDADRKDGPTSVHSSLVFLPREGLNADEVANGLKTAFEQRFDWVRKTLSKAKPSYSPDMYYGKLDTSKNILHNATSGVIDAPVEKVWALFREFGKMDSWWRDYYTGDIAVAPGSVDRPQVGQVRSFETLSHTKYKEMLLELDEKAYKMVYSLEYMDPAALSGAVTTIDFDADPSNKNKTLVTWTSAFTLLEKCYPLASQISERQKKVYDLGILSLQQHFNATAGKPALTVAVTEGYMGKAGCDYMFLFVGDGASERVQLSRKGNVVDSRQLRFSYSDLRDSLSIRVIDNRMLRGDVEVGVGHVVLQDLAGACNCVVPIKDKSGKEVGRFTLAFKLQVAPPTPEQAMQALAADIGKIGLAFGKEVYKNISEIAAAMTPNINALWEYGEYSKEFGPLPKFCKVLPASEAISPVRSGQLFQRFQEFVYSEIPLAKVLTDPAAAAQIGQSDIYSVLLRGWIERTEKLYKEWSQDEEIATQLIRGVNPMKITCLHDKAVLPKGFEGLKDDAGRNVDQIIAERSLFYCDYYELMHGEYDEEHGFYSHQAHLDIIGKNLGPRKYWYAPFLVLYKSASTGKLSILGFQLTRHKSKANETYSKQSHPPNVYQLAKLHLTCADNQHHQFVSHLGLTHLSMEPFAVALHNAFPTDPVSHARHPVGKLLHAHFKDTIGINFLARQTLVSEFAPFTDSTFSPGTKNAMKIFSTAFQQWDFLGSNFVNDLKSRGFDEQGTDGLPGFYYRDDGFKLWNALAKYVRSIIDELYPSDDVVLADAVLQGWCAEMTGPAGIATFPKKLAAKSTLVETIVSIMFYCSAQHAAVNFPQERYVMYVPNRPDSLLIPMKPPAGAGQDINRDFFKQAMPSLANTEFQVLFGHLLTSPPDNPFSEYSAMNDEFPAQWKAFSDELRGVSASIQSRNKALIDAGDIPYEYLDPQRVPQSINI